jgi:DNA-binding HxlR family transcriptional regulator
MPKAKLPARRINPGINMRHMTCDGQGCPVEACTGILTGKWKGEILHWLLEGSKRQGELRRFISGATTRDLTNQLQELEEAGVIQRRVMEGMPRRVEYSLTETGKSLKPVIKAAWQWGRLFLDSHPNSSSVSQSMEKI